MTNNNNNNTNEGNKMNKQIQVGDKVKWSGPRSLNVYRYGYVTSTDEMVIGNPCYGITACEDNEEIKVSKDQVTHASSRYVRV